MPSSLRAQLPTRLAPTLPGRPGPSHHHPPPKCRMSHPGTPRRKPTRRRDVAGERCAPPAAPPPAHRQQDPGDRGRWSRRASPPARINIPALENTLASLFAGSGNIVPGGKRASFIFLQSVCSFAVYLLNPASRESDAASTKPLHLVLLPEPSHFQVWVFTASCEATQVSF